MGYNGAYHRRPYISSNLACMTERKSSFIKVDELMPQVSIEKAAVYYGITLPKIRHVGDEIRMKCFLACGRTEETGDRAIAVQADNPVKPWKCHVYQCQKGGNLVGLCDLMKSGENAGGRPRGERFKAIAADLAAMVGGAEPPIQSSEPIAVMKSPKAPTQADMNVPLAESGNERARELITLNEQFITDVAEMPPEASAYFRRRPFLTPDVCQKFAMGYLPQSAKSLLRGHVVYGYRAADGQVLTWFGRNVRYEEQIARWKASDRSESEPIKTRFVKGFHRGLELYGEDIVRLDAPTLTTNRLVVVEGPNDAIRLNALRVPAVALCSNNITHQQLERISALARDLRMSAVTLMLDCDEEGINGTRQVLPILAERLPVQLAWSDTTTGGKFKGRQPENLTAEEWEEVCLGQWNE